LARTEKLGADRVETGVGKHRSVPLRGADNERKNAVVKDRASLATTRHLIVSASRAVIHLTFVLPRLLSAASSRGTSVTRFRGVWQVQLTEIASSSNTREHDCPAAILGEESVLDRHTRARDSWPIIDCCFHVISIATVTLSALFRVSMIYRRSAEGGRGRVGRLLNTCGRDTPDFHVRLRARSLGYRMTRRWFCSRRLSVKPKV